MHLVRVERAVLERIRRVARFLQIALGERVGIDDEDPARGQVFEVRLERRRIHRHEHVRCVARREDVVVGEVELEAGDARQRARGRTDLGREIREGGEVVAEERRLRGHPPARELHPVTGVAGEPDDDRFELLDGLRGHALVVARTQQPRSGKRGSDAR